MTTLLATTALIGTATASTQQATELQHARHVVTFFQNHSWLRAPNQNRCTAVPWQHSCTIARRIYRQKQTLIRQIETTIPYTNDWRTAVTLTQKVFPGTSEWLLYISDREGGYGPFVMNHQGSGAGGWMQFMSSTFYAYSDDARRAVEARGFRVDPSVWTWTHPLGQALTAGYMRYTGRDGCHWCL